MKNRFRESFKTMVLFALLIYLGNHSYLLEWLARRYFCFVWIPVFLLHLFRHEILARWITLGALGGMFLGQLAEDMKWYLLDAENQVAHSSYWGVGIWFLMVFLSIAIGIFHTWIKSRKKNATEA